jgi:VCBS repeat-containing protein
MSQMPTALERVSPIASGQKLVTYFCVRSADRTSHSLAVWS